MLKHVNSRVVTRGGHFIPSHSVRKRRMALVLALCSLAAIVSYSPGQAQVPSADQNVMRSFQEAAARWDVPVQILMGIGYVESHWEQRDGEPSLDDGYGIMHLVDGPGGTLERAASLTGLPSEAIRKEPSANIHAGAAILNDISHKINNTNNKQNKLAEWHDVVALYSGSAERSVMESYAQEVYRVIVEGRAAQLASGEVVTLAQSNVSDLPKPTNFAPESDDYPGALWVAAHSNNYRVGRPFGPLSYIVIHDTEGSYSGAISWFQNPNAGVSAHYVIRSSDGQITQMVREANTAYHAGNWDYNVRSVGIEHEGYMNQQGWYTEAMYQASSALARTVADKYGMKKDRAHIIAHSQVPGSTHLDPGPFWDWSLYMGLVRRDSARVARVDNTDSGFQATPSQIDPQHSWWVYGNGFNGSSTYATMSVSNPQYSTNSGTWRANMPSSGFYDIYAFIPYVDNNIADTANARYKVHSADGLITAPVSQQAITNVGTGSWAHLGRFRFNGGTEAIVYLDDYTGESGRNVWYDAMMWIPSLVNMPLPTSTSTPAVTATRTPTATNTRIPSATATRTPTRTHTPRPTGTATRTPSSTSTATPLPTWTPGPCGMRFSDLEDTHWAYQYIGYLYCRGVISGYADGTVRPNNGSTRAQFAKMLALGFRWNVTMPAQPSFHDVPSDHPFYQYIEAAYAMGIIGGYADGTFKPHNPVTRGQVAKMLVLAREWSLYRPGGATFTDVPLDHWAYPYVETAFLHSIIGGYDDGTFRPHLDVTRAQLSKMLTLGLQQGAGR